MRILNSRVDTYRKMVTIVFLSTEDNLSSFCQDMTEQGFEIFYNNINGIVNEFNTNSAINGFFVPNKFDLNRIRAKNLENVIWACIRVLRDHPTEIKNFSLFSTSITNKYFDYLNYYYDVYSKNNQDDLAQPRMFINASQTAKEKIMGWLTEILENEG